MTTTQRVPAEIGLPARAPRGVQAALSHLHWLRHLPLPPPGSARGGAFHYNKTLKIEKVL
jgi:hypothetical protein